MTETKPTSLMRKVLIGFGATGIGLVAGLGVGRLVPHSGGHRWSDALAMGVAAGLVLMGGLLLLAVVSPPVARKLAKANTVSKRAVQQFLLQGVTTVLAGVMMAIPPVFLANEGIDDTRSAIVMAVIAGLFAVQSWINFDLWRKADEFFRRAMVETSAISFWVLQGALFLWAVAERTGYAPALQSWDFVAVLMAVYMLLSVIVARKLGVE